MVGEKPEEVQGWLLLRKRLTDPLVCLIDPGCKQELPQKELQPLGEIKLSTDAGQPVVLAECDIHLRSSGNSDRESSISWRRGQCTTEKRELELVAGD